MKYRIVLIFILASLGSMAQTGCSSTKINFNTGSYYYPQCFLDSIYIDKVTANQYLYVNSQKKVVSVSASSLTYSAGRGLTLNSNTFRIDTTKSLTWTNNIKLLGNLTIGTGTYVIYGGTGNAMLGQVYATQDVVATTYFERAGRSRIYSSADGLFNLTNNGATTFTRLTFGLENTSHPALQVNGKKLVTMLGDGSATSNFQVKDTTFNSTTWDGSLDATTKNEFRDNIILKVNYTDTATMLSKYLRSADTLKLHNQVAARVKYSDTAAMLAPYLKESDTLNIHNQIIARVRYTDTASMLTKYFRKADSTQWHNQFTNLNGAHKNMAITYVAALSSPTSGTNNTIMDVKTIALPANTLVRVGDRIKLQVAIAGNTASPIQGTLKLNGVSLDNLYVSNASFQRMEIEVQYVDATHANIMGSSTSYSSFQIQVSGFDWTASQNIVLSQNNVSSTHIDVYSLTVDYLPITH